MSSDGKTGDGAGILIDIPHEYFNRVCEFELPAPREYAVGMVFLPKSSNQFKLCTEIFEEQLKKSRLRNTRLEKSSTDTSNLGQIAAKTEPRITNFSLGKTEKT